ncbi:MAG: heme exporter protein CcmB, partial [Gammaproteobacteria bacterium]|nr:heme exporter protein CcmB [Gammaproteobacteria bacterium]
MNLFIASVQRDLLVHFRHPSEVLNPLVFFIVVISLFPLGIGPEPGQLKEIAPGIVWVAALLATLMSMDSMFRSDFEDGSLEQIVLSEQSTFIFVLAKVVSHWLLSGLPLVLLMPLAALLLFLDEAGVWALT